jgi:hypothetical protein
MNTNAKLPTRNVAGVLEATSRAVLAADEAWLSEAMAGPHWERRGWLRRLVCAERAERLRSARSPRRKRLAA